MAMQPSGPYLFKFRDIKIDNAESSKTRFQYISIKIFLEAYFSNKQLFLFAKTMPMSATHIRWASKALLTL